MCRSDTETLIVKVVSGCGLAQCGRVDCGLGGVTR